jgi:AcrR family transcriptional regulator
MCDNRRAMKVRAAKVKQQKTEPQKKPRGDYHHGNLRRALLDCALSIIDEKGPEAFTVREAARRLGVDHRAAYRHFQDRDAVIAAVAEEGYRALVDVLEEALAREDGADAPTRLIVLGRAYAMFALREPARYRVMTGPRSNESGRFPELEIPIARAFDLVKREIQAGVDAGDIVDARLDECAAVLWAEMHGLAILIIMRRVRVRPDRVREFTTRAMTHLVYGLKRR